MKNKIEEEELLVERYKKFLDSRREDGSVYVKKIINFLVDNVDNEGEGWVRALKLKEGLKIKKELKTKKPIPMCSDHTLFRLLDGLKSEGIVNRKEKNPNEVYYRISPLFGSKVPTEYGLKKEYQRLYRENIELANNLELANSILELHGFIEEYDAEMEKRKVAKEKKKHLTRDEKLGKILNMTPEQMIERNAKLARSKKMYFKEDIKKLEGESAFEPN